MSSKLFPQIDYSTVNAAIDQAPYLNLEWQFYNVSEIKRLANQKREKIPSGQSFSRWSAHRDREVRKVIGMEIAQDPFHRLDLYSDYILALADKDFNKECIVELFERFKKYVKENVIEGFDELPSNLIVTLLLYPVFRWEKKISKVGNELIKIIESTLDMISARLRVNFDSDLLAFQNQIFFVYFVISGKFRIGLSASVGAYFSRIFRSVTQSKWSSTRSDVRVQYASIILNFTMAFYELDKPFKTKYGFSYESLALIRSIFQEAGNAELEATFVPSQWVFRWLVDKLDVEVFGPGARADISALAALSPVEQNLAVELVRRFSAYRVPVSMDSLTDFLLQFGTTQRIRGALRLLARVKFCSLWELAQSIENALAEELTRTRKSKLVISAFGEHTGSAAIMNYLVAHSPLANSLVFEPNLPSALSATRTNDSIYIVDDCLLSGTQGLNTLGDLMGTRERKSHHTVHAPELSTRDKRRLEKRNLRFTYGVVMDRGMERFKGGDYDATGLDSARADVLYGIIEPASSKIFEPLGPVSWLNQEERDEMRSFCKEIGYSILESRSQRKEWDDERRRESALGFSDMQRLLVFPYNVPKTSLTLLWERSTENFKWRPLFPGFD